MDGINFAPVVSEESVGFATSHTIHGDSVHSKTKRWSFLSAGKDHSLRRGESSRLGVSTDESGESSALMNDAGDPAVRSLINHCFHFYSDQEKEVDRLDAECHGIEEDNRQLRSRISAAERKQMMERSVVKSNQIDDISSHSPYMKVDPSNPKREFIDELHDEFEDLQPDTEQLCVFDTALQRDVVSPLRFSYAEPSVTGGIFPVFKAGLLYRIVAEDGSWFFFNDTLKYKMEVKFIFGSLSKLSPGPKTRLRRLPSGEYEARVWVLPMETEALVFGVVNGFDNASVAHTLTSAYTNRHVKRQNDAILAELQQICDRVRKKCSNVSENEVLGVVLRSGGDDVLDFIDPHFPPIHTSLYRPSVDANFIAAHTWHRPMAYLSDLSPHPARLFRGCVRPGDPHLGEGGDLYLVSAMAILAEFPMKVRELFRHPLSIAAGKAERRRHAFRVRVHSGGWWRSVCLDDYLPASRRGPVSMRCDDDLCKLWVPLLEKAYAKVHGSYAAIQFGDVLEALQDFTGFPTYRFDAEWIASRAEGFSPTRGSNLFLVLESRHHRGDVVCLSAPDEGPTDSALTQLGFKYGMSYCVLDMERHDDARLVKIRCPSLRADWDALGSGKAIKWDDHSELDTVRCFPEKEDVRDSIWLDWNEALSLFEGGGICFTRFAFQDYRVRGFFDKLIPNVVLELHVTTPVEAYCILSQEDDRGKDPNDPTAELAPLMLCVSCCDGQDADAQFLDLCASTDPDMPARTPSFIVGRDIAMHYRFTPKYSPYLIIPRIHESNGKRPYTIGMLTSRSMGDGMHVNFVKPHPDCKVFSGKKAFTSCASESVETEFQIRSQHGIVTLKKGTGIFGVMM